MIPVKQGFKTLILPHVRGFHCTPITFLKKWNELNKNDKQDFIKNYVSLYKEKYPCSKSNVMYRALASEMDEYNDTPYVFGVLYNEIRAVERGESTDNKKGSGPMGDSDFAKLLYK
ncbi:unnamed protein product [Kluyveromyces dobzhanskii CBS 2104]|uniref:WGS project CCBQ000000000 data, contig 00058 n=1 Tax=Kluyveromyces dobzhanskii CBS 2104 TaxID=1427455 RepID=A0A0A8LDJ1_9SACH|nr:unnamed protein product [Kluyveromyces dobzhanskii CBS 2104]